MIYICVCFIYIPPWSTEVFIFLGTGGAISLRLMVVLSRKKNTYQELFFRFSAKHKRKENGLALTSKCFQFLNVRSLL